VAPPGNQAANGEGKAQPARWEQPAYSPDFAILNQVIGDGLISIRLVGAENRKSQA